MTTNRIRGLAAAFSMFAAPLAAQEFFGKWDNLGVPVPQLFVSVTGSDSNLGNDPSAPLRTITNAVGRALLLSGPTTINVSPGTYDTAGGEVFPITLPRNGIAIEAYAANGGQPIIDTNNATVSPTDVFRITGNGTESHPDSELRGLEVILATGWTGVNIQDGGTTEVNAVTVEDCRFVAGPNFAVGVKIEVGTGAAEHRLLHNVFAGEPKVNAGIAILDQQFGGTSSTILRSNQAWRWEFTYSGQGSDPSEFQPRLFSNAFQHSETLLSIGNAESWLLNNTFAYATPFSAAQVPLIGIDLAGGTLHLHNTILWLPDVPNYTEIDINGAGTIDAQFSDAIRPLGGTNLTNVNPQFVGWPLPTHPGGLQFVDLHLLSTSLLRGAGSPALVAPIKAIPYAGGFARGDVAYDMDLDPRLNAGPPNTVVDDIGADQRTLARIAPAASATPIDQFGNLRPVSRSGGTATYSIDVQVTGPANTPYAMFMALGFTNTVPPGVENESVFQNLLLPGVGVFHFGLGTNENSAFGGGTLDASGNAMQTIPLTLGDNFAREIELHLQAVVLGSPTWMFTNRQRIELNW